MEELTRRALLFIGFMGAGKSTALEVVREAGLKTVETDDLIERELGEPIAAYFEREGEAAFREQEAKVIVPLLELVVPPLDRAGYELVRKLLFQSPILGKSP